MRRHRCRPPLSRTVNRTNIFWGRSFRVVLVSTGRAAAAVAAANSGPIGTHGLQCRGRPAVAAQTLGSMAGFRVANGNAGDGATFLFSHTLPIHGLCLYRLCRSHLRP